jgi:hypothetical protein
MKIILFVSAAISGLFGLFLLLIARGGIHEATAATFFVVSAVSFAGAGIIGAINHVEKKLDSK